MTSIESTSRTLSDDGLMRSYERCRDLTRAHGTTYYWSTRLLPRDRQPHVFALYAYRQNA